MWFNLSLGFKALLTHPNIPTSPIRRIELLCQWFTAGVSAASLVRWNCYFFLQVSNEFCVVLRQAISYGVLFLLQLSLPPWLCNPGHTVNVALRVSHTLLDLYLVLLGFLGTPGPRKGGGSWRVGSVSNPSSSAPALLNLSSPPHGKASLALTEGSRFC